MKSQPIASSCLVNDTVPSPVHPPSIQSVADTRYPIGLSSGQTARTASNTSSPKRIRFSRPPRYRCACWRMATGTNGSNIRAPMQFDTLMDCTHALTTQSDG